VLFSDADFTPHGKAIRFGLTAIKNVGRNAIDSILAARSELAAKGKSFASYWEFCEKIDLRLINKRVLESLIKSGALDSFGRRSQLMAATDKAMERAQKANRDLATGQHGLFGIFDDDPGIAQRADDLPKVPDWDENQRLQAEKEVLGFFVSGHPLDKYAEKLRNLVVVDTATALEMKPATNGHRGQPSPENEVAVAGVIVGLRVAKSKRSGEMYAQASLEDTVGKIDLICFPKDYERLAESLKIEVPVLVKGQLRAEEDAAPKIAVSSVQALEDVKLKLPSKVLIRVPLERASDAMLVELKEMIGASPGPGRLMLNLEQRGEFIVVMEAPGVTVGADRGFIDRAETLLGRDMVKSVD
jgi:DNA polymerase-3 subunit alpha